MGSIVVDAVTRTVAEVERMDGLMKDLAFEGVGACMVIERCEPGLHVDVEQEFQRRKGETVLRVQELATSMEFVRVDFLCCVYRGIGRVFSKEASRLCRFSFPAPTPPSSCQ